MIQVQNDILKQFYYGLITPSEKRFEPDSEYGKAYRGLAEEEEKLRSILEKDALDSLVKMTSLQIEVTGLTAEGYYIDSFRTGFRFALAVMDDDNFLKGMVDTDDRYD